MRKDGVKSLSPEVQCQLANSPRSSPFISYSNSVEKLFKI